ncbi:hypothetical protein RyT2_18450 [Pseudolactococcus yaeyamensis]
MGFKLVVEGGPEKIEFSEEQLTGVKFVMDTPEDSNARSTDVGTTLIVKGKILTATAGEKTNGPLQLAKWSVVPVEQADTYRSVAVGVVNAGQVVREFTFPNAFVVDYTESFGDTEGIGEFILKIKQKKDKNKDVKLEGGYGI